MRAGRPLLYLAVILGAAAWLVLRDRSAPTDLAASRKANECRRRRRRSPIAVSAERTKDPLASKDGTAPDEVKRTEKPEPFVDPRLAPRDFVVHLFDEADGSPVADAQCFVGPYDVDLFRTVTLEWGNGLSVRTHFGSSSFAEMAQATARSGGDGFATIVVPGGVAPVVAVVADGFVPAYFVANTRGYGLNVSRDENGSRERALEIGLARGASLEGVVLGAGRRRLVGATVALHFVHHELRRPRSSFESTVAQTAQAHATTDVAGRFEFDGLPADVAIDLEVTEADGKAPRDETELWLDPGERRRFEWLVDGGARVRGRVVCEDASPIGETEVSIGASDRAHGATTTVDVAGEFELASRQIGDVALNVEPRDGRHAATSLVLHLAEGERRDGVVVVVPAAAPLLVRAVDRDGKAEPLDQARAWSCVNQRHYVDSSRDEPESERGKVRLASVPLGDLIVHVAQSRGYLGAAEVAFHHDGAHDCVVPLDAGAMLNVSIVDGADHRTPVVGSATLLRRDSLSGFAFQYMMGSMSAPSLLIFGGLAAGSYDVVAESDDGRVGVVAGVKLGVGESHDGVVVAVERAATLELCASAPSAALPFGQRFSFEVRRGEVGVVCTGAPPLGRAHVNVPPGHLTIELRAGRDLVATREVDARAGVVTRVRF